MLYIVQGTLEKMWDYLRREGMASVCGKGRLPPLSSLKQLKTTCLHRLQCPKVNKEFHECMGVCGRCSALCEYDVANQESKNS